MHFSAFVALASSLVAFANPLEKRTPAQIEADITSITSSVNSLDSAINAFPNTGGSLTQALAIHTDATNLGSIIQKGTSDVQANGPVDDADGNTILSEVKTLQPLITKTLNDLVGKKTAFDNLPLGGVSSLVLEDLNNLSADTKDLENALVSAAPADLLPQATPITSSIDAAFATAIAAYEA